MNRRLVLPALVGALTLWLLPTAALAWLGPICDHGVIHHLEQGQPGATDTAFFDYLATHQGSFEMQEGDVCLPPATPDPTPTRTPTSAPSLTPTTPPAVAPSSTSGTNSGLASTLPPTAMPSTSSATTGPGTGSTSGQPAFPGGMSSNASTTSAGGNSNPLSQGNSPGADNSRLLTICDRQPGGTRTIQIHEEQLPAYRREVVNLGPCGQPSRTPTVTAISTSTPRTTPVGQTSFTPTAAPFTAIPTTVPVILTDQPQETELPDAIPAPERVVPTTERPLPPLTLLPRTGTGPNAVAPTMWLVAGTIVAAAVWYGRRRRS